MKTLKDACVPRQSVFEDRGSDTLYNIDQLKGFRSAAVESRYHEV